VGLNTPFLPENLGAPLYNFGFYKIQRHTKAIFAELLKNFFSSMAKTYALTIPEILDLENTIELEKLFISQDFPYMERKLPLLVISISDIKEKKMYLGADNVIGYRVLGTSTGQRTVEVYGGACNATIKITSLTLSIDDRMKLIELLNLCFSHYYRWQYYYTFDDGTLFNITPNAGTLSFGGDVEEANTSKTSMIYANTLTMESFIEYTWTSTEVVERINHTNITAEVLEPDLTEIIDNEYIDENAEYYP
jgi:hypothetical protein